MAAAPSPTLPPIADAPAPRRAWNLPPALWWTREACALAVWTYAALDVLVLNVDEALAEAVPLLSRVLAYKGLAVLCAAAGAWLLLGHKRFGLTVGYVAVYPFVVVLWKVPKWVVQNGSLAVAFLPAVYTVSQAFRRTFVLGVGALVALTAALHAETEWVVWAGIAYLLGYLGLHYVRRFVGSFNRSTVFSASLQGVQKLRAQMDETGVIARTARVQNDDEDPMSRVLGGYMLLSGLRIAAEKLREVSETRRIDLYLISSLVFTLALTTGVFAAVFVGLERLDPASFNGPDGFGLWTSLGYSFSTLVPSDLMGIRPGTPAARALSLAESACSVLLLILLVFVVLTSTRERYRSDLDRVIAELRASAESAGRSLEREFEATMVEIETALLKSSPGVMDWLAGYDPALRQIKAAEADRGTSSRTRATGSGSEVALVPEPHQSTRPGTG